MKTHTLTIPAYINTGFLKNLCDLGPNPVWGASTGPGETNTIVFDAAYLSEVTSVLENYDAEWLAYAKKQKLEELAIVRAQHEQKGPNGLELTDKTVARLTAAAVGLLIDENRQSIRWELTRGNFIELSRATLLGMSALSVQIVQDCFDNVYEKTQLIKAVELTGTLQEALAELDAIDLTDGWPN